MPADKKGRLGQMLMRRGLLARPQLVKALSNQMVYGARIGTNLVELEFVSIDDVSEALGDQLGVAPASDALLAGLDERSVRTLLPPDLARDYQAIPLRLTPEGVLVAMIDPTPRRVAELANQLGRPVHARVAPELRVLYLLERYYGFERPTRFLRLPDGNERDQGRRRYLAPIVTPSARGAPLPAKPVSQTSTYRAATTRAAEGLLGAPQLLQHAPLTPGAWRQATATGGPLGDLFEALAGAQTGAHLAGLLVQPLCEAASLGVLFWVRGDMAVGCCARGASATFARLQQLVLPLEQPSLLHWSRQLKTVVRAKAEADPLQRTIAEFLGTAPAREVCVAPVVLGDRVVNLIVTHAQNTPFHERAVRDYARLSSAATAAYARLRSNMRRSGTGGHLPS